MSSTIWELKNLIVVVFSLLSRTSSSCDIHFNMFSFLLFYVLCITTLKASAKLYNKGLVDISSLLLFFLEMKIARLRQSNENYCKMEVPLKLFYMGKEENKSLITLNKREKQQLLLYSSSLPVCMNLYKILTIHWKPILIYVKPTNQIKSNQIRSFNQHQLWNVWR